MTAPRMTRSIAAVLFAACVGFVALPGCGPDKKADPKKDEKKDETKPSDPNAPKGDGATPPKPDTPPKTTLGAVEKEADDAATAFRRELIQGTAKGDLLSASFLKAVGKPLRLPSDKDKGFSADSATSWLRNVGAGISGFGAEMKRPEQAGDVVYLRGGLQKPGAYCLRLVKEGGAWKADWLSVTSVPVENGVTNSTPTPEGAAQGFAVASFVDTVCDLDGMPQGERATLLAAAITPALRTAWAPPVGEVTPTSYEFNPSALIREVTKIGGKTTAYTATRVGDLPEFKVELTKTDGKKVYVIKLVKGAGPHDWLVSEVTEAKG